MKFLPKILDVTKHAAKENVTTCVVRSIDLGYATVLPKGGTRAIKAKIVGDPDAVASGDELSLVFSATGANVLTNAAAKEKGYTLETHAERHASSGVDPLTPEMIGAAKTDHGHDASEIAGLVEGSREGFADWDEKVTVPANNDVFLVGDSTNAFAKVKLAWSTILTTLQSFFVEKNRSISTTAPLTGGGDLSANRTLGISAATTGAAGSMSAADKSKLDGITAGANMLKSVYDVGNNGKVDVADKAVKTESADGLMSVHDNGSNPILTKEAIVQAVGSGGGGASVTLSARTGGGVTTALTVAGGAASLNGNEVFHRGNDGSGSGLDADTLRGKWPEWFQQAGVIAEIGTSSDGTNASTYAWTNGWYIVGPYTSNMPVASKWWYVQAFVTEDSGVLLQAYLTDGSNNNSMYIRWKGGGSWLTGWQYANQYTHPNHSGDVTSAGDGATTIGNDKVTNAKLANMAARTIKGRKTLSTGDPEDLSAADLVDMLNYIYPGGYLNAYSLAGNTPDENPTANTIVKRNSGGYIRAVYFYNSHGLSTRNTDTEFYTGYNNDGYLRRNTRAGARQSMGLGYGTSFPGSPADGDNFFRTDLGWWCHYKSGVGWLTSHEYAAQSQYITGGTASFVSLEASAVRQDYRPYITRLVGNFYTATTLDASNYWSAWWRTIDQSYASADNLWGPGLLYANGWRANVAGQASYNVNRLSTINPVAHFDWLMSKTGNPGPISCDFTTYYRLLVG